MARNRVRGGVIAAGLVAALTVGAVAGGAVAQAGRSGMDISVRGIEDTIRQLNTVQGNPQAQQAAIVLLLIQGLGKKQPEAGHTRYDYRVDTQPDGHILINGLDISELIKVANQKPR